MKFFKYAKSDEYVEPVTIQLSGSMEPSLTVALNSQKEEEEGTDGGDQEGDAQQGDAGTDPDASAETDATAAAEAEAAAAAAAEAEANPANRLLDDETTQSSKITLSIITYS